VIAGHSIRPDAAYEPRALQPGGRGLHDLAALIRRIHKGLRRERGPFARVEARFRTAAPDLDHCRIVGLHEGRLEIGVPDAVLMAELAGFRREELLAALQPDVADLRFRLLPREDA